MTDARRLLGESERLDWLRLIRSENIGPVTFFALLRHFGSVAAALEAAPELSRRGGRKRAIRIAPAADAAREAAALAGAGGTLIAACEPAYPAALAAIADPPPVIQVLGEPALLSRRAVAVVGARNASAAGRRMARDLASGLGAAGLVVVSGMARGIDAAAHEATLGTGSVAAVAGGVDVIYPKENTALYGQLAASGAVMSEQPFGTQPTARHFPPRNRLISGLSLGVVVVEAAPRSGSLITARMALEQGREVFAVPGSPLDPRYRGTNGLIREGAVLTESAADVIENLGGALRPPLGETPGGDIAGQPPGTADESALAEARARLLEMLGPVPVTVDELLRECQLSPPAAMTVLLELELAERLERHPGNRVSLIS
jgi:DNA processing protein